MHIQYISVDTNSMLMEQKISILEKFLEMEKYTQVMELELEMVKL